MRSRGQHCGGAGQMLGRHDQCVGPERTLAGAVGRAGRRADQGRQIQAGQNANYWINKLVGAAGVRRLWPNKATPAEAQRMGTLPPETFLVKLCAV